MPTNAINDTGVKYLYDKLHGEIEPIAEAVSDSEVTIEGNPINFTTLSAQTAKSTILSVEPIQDLHGYDKPWVGGAGINKAEFIETPSTQTQNFSYSKNEADDIVCTKTTNTSSFFGSFKIHVTESGLYTFSATITGYVTCYGYKDSLPGEKVFDGGTLPRTETLPQGDIIIGFYAGSRVTQGTSLSIQQFRANKGSSDLGYAPYENLCPISGRSEIGILGCGKNLFDSNTVEQGGINQTTGQDEPSSAVKRTGYLPVSGNNIFLNSPGGTMRIFFYDKYKNYLSNEPMLTKEYSMALPNGTFYIRCIGINSIFNSNIMISAGTNDVPYSSYTESNDITIYFGQTVYGGTLDVENGVLTVDKKLVDMSTFSWIDNTVSGYQRFRTENVISDATTPQSDTDKIQCSCIEINNNPISQTSGNGLLIHTNGYLYVRYEQVDNLTDFISAVTGQTICYTLATPITINLTPNTINLLKGVNNISTDGDKITLTYRDGSVATLGDLTSAVDSLDGKIEDSKILTDTETGDKYILVVTNGVLSIQQVSN